MTESPPYPVTVYTDPAIGLTVTGFQVPAGALAYSPGTWVVTFQCRPHGIACIDSSKTAHWLPSGRWDDTRWNPIGHHLVPPAALAAVQAWLAEQAAEAVK